MAGKTLSPLPKYWTIGKWEKVNVDRSLRRPLSGYVGGKPSEGFWVNQLSDDWKEAFDVNFAIPCNSATSGLMAACMAAGIGEGSKVLVSTYTMSATATAPMLLGAEVTFADIDPTYFCMDTSLNSNLPDAIIVTNLFGCAGYLQELRAFCDRTGVIMIEDNAQAPFATQGGRWAGTIGHIGVFSLNVHKHIQCGEGGIIVTDDPNLADRLEGAINHGELAVNIVRPINRLGGNFRMVEPVAAIACSQLKKGFSLVQSRIALAEHISDMFREVPFVTTPRVKPDTVHVFYMWAGKIIGEDARDTRYNFVTRLRDRGVPFRLGYSPLLHKMFEEGYSLPVAEEMEEERLFTFEICAYDPNSHHLRRMRDIIIKEADILIKEMRDDEQTVSG